MKSTFDKLIADFCRLCGIAELEAVAAGAAIDVDEVYFCLSYSEEVAPDRLFVFCDYGEVPEGRQAEVYRALLETNLYTYPTDTAVFTVSPGSGRVTCAQRFALDPLKAEELRGIMAFQSRKAKEWREHYFGIAPQENAAGAKSHLGRKMHAEMAPANRSR